MEVITFLSFWISVGNAIDKLVSYSLSFLLQVLIFYLNISEFINL